MRKKTVYSVLLNITQFGKKYFSLKFLQLFFFVKMTNYPDAIIWAVVLCGYLPLSRFHSFAAFHQNKMDRGQHRSSYISGLFLSYFLGMFAPSIPSFRVFKMP